MNQKYDHQKNQQQDNNHQYQHKHYYNYNNNYIDTGAGRVWLPEEGERIKEAYCDNISDRMTQAAASLIEKAYQAGLTVDEIIMAIEETGLAPSPSPYYLKAILSNWAENGVTVSRLRHYVAANKANPWWK